MQSASSLRYQPPVHLLKIQPSNCSVKTVSSEADSVGRRVIIRKKIKAVICPANAVGVSQGAAVLPSSCLPLLGSRLGQYLSAPKQELEDAERVGLLREELTGAANLSQQKRPFVFVFSSGWSHASVLNCKPAFPTETFCCVFVIRSH